MEKRTDPRRDLSKTLPGEKPKSLLARWQSWAWVFSLVACLRIGADLGWFTPAPPPPKTVLEELLDQRKRAEDLGLVEYEKRLDEDIARVRAGKPPLWRDKGGKVTGDEMDRFIKETEKALDELDRKRGIDPSGER